MAFEKKNQYKHFIKFFFFFFTVLALIFGIICWETITYTSYKKIKIKIEKQEYIVLSTINFLIKNGKPKILQEFLETLVNDTSDISEVVYFNVRTNKIEASSNRNLIGKSPSSDPDNFSIKYIQGILENKKSQETIEDQQNFYTTLKKDNSIIFIKFTAKEIRKRFLYFSFFNTLVLVVVFIISLVIFTNVILRKLLVPLNTNLYNVQKLSPLFFGKFQEEMPIKDRNNRFFSLIRTYIDNVQLQEFHENWMNSVIEQVPVGLIFTNTTKPIFMNTSMAELLGISPDHPHLEGWRDYIDKEDQKEITDNWEKGLKTYTSGIFKCRISTPEAVKRWVLVHTIPLRTPSDEVVGIIGAFIPIDKEVALQEQVSKSEKNESSLEYQKTSLITIVSRELRTPLTVIQQTLEVVHEASVETLDDDSKSFLNICNNNLNKIIKLLQDVLEYEKIEFENYTINKSNFQLNEFLNSLKTEFEKPFKEKNVSFATDCPNDLEVSADYDKLMVAVKNIVDNALQFTSAGEVVVKAHVKDSQLNIEVTDTGIGIHEEDFPQLFKLFSQLGETSLRVGSGLGLALAKKISEKHGGSITFSSEFGKGSTFVIHLPYEEK